jgi:hypothetical protein
MSLQRVDIDSRFISRTMRTSKKRTRSINELQSTCTHRKQNKHKSALNAHACIPARRTPVPVPAAAQLTGGGVCSPGVSHECCMMYAKSPCSWYLHDLNEDDGARAMNMGA